MHEKFGDFAKWLLLPKKIDENALNMGSNNNYNANNEPQPNVPENKDDKFDNIERYSIRLKRFRKVFTRYDKLDSIFISTIFIAFIFDLFFM